MLTARIRAFTRWLGAPAGWEPSRYGACAHLAIRDEVMACGPVMISAWEPTPDELERLKAGALVELWVVGALHPPVALTVGEAPSVD